MTTVYIPGDPGGLEALAGQLEGAAEDVDSVRDRVATNGLDGDWSGRAADAFRATLHHLPSELATVGGAFGDAMGTIRGFAGRLAELQQQARWYEQKLQESERDLQEANARHDEAVANLHSANRERSAAADPVSVSAADREIERGESILRRAVADVEDVTGAVSQFSGGADSIRHEYEDAVSSCCSALNAAHPPGESLWSGLRHGFHDISGGAIRLGGDAWHGVDRGLHDAEEGAVKAAHYAIHEFDEHWGELRQILEVTAAILTVATLVVLLTIATGGAGDAVLAGWVASGAAGGVASGLGAFGLADAVSVAEGDSIAADTGEKQYSKDLPGDAFNVGLSLFGVGAGLFDDTGPIFDLVTTPLEGGLGEIITGEINEDVGASPLGGGIPYLEPALLQPTSFLLGVPSAELFQ